MKEPGRHVKTPAEDSREITLLRQLDLLVAELETLGFDVAAARHAERLRATRKQEPREPFDPITAVRLALAQAGNRAESARRMLRDVGRASDDPEVLALAIVGYAFTQAASTIAVACQNRTLPDPEIPR